MLNSIVHSLRKQSFQPNFLSLFINPFFFIRRGLFRHIRKNSHHLKGELIDFGCGRKPYRNLISVEKYVGVDIEVSGHPHLNSQIDVFYDGHTIPFNDQTFDSFLCSEVFEHLFNLQEILRELHRVLKPGGKGLITVPFLWPEHEQPYDFGRYTSFGMRAILESHGFTVVSLEKSGHYVECLFQQAALYMFTIFHSKSQALNTVFTAILISPVNIIGVLLSAILPRKKDMFHNLVIVVQK